MTDSVQFDQVYASLSTDSIDSLKQKFTTLLASASNNYVQFETGSSNVIMSSVAGISPDKVIDGGDNTDYFVIDDYQVANIKDIDVEVTSFKNAEGKDVSGYKVSIIGMDGTTRTYNLVNIESIRFIDENKVVQTVDFQNNVRNLKQKENSAIYLTGSPGATGARTLTKFDDVVELNGTGIRLSTAEGNDTIRVNKMAWLDKYSASKGVDIINGGAGIDTLELPNIAASEIQNISKDIRKDIYTIKTIYGRKILFKGVEKVKFLNQNYTIDDFYSKFNNENKIKTQGIRYDRRNAEELANGRGGWRGNNTIVIEEIGALASGEGKAAFIYGHAGEDMVDLTLIPNVTVSEYTLENGVYTITLQIGTETRKLKTLNIEKLNLSTGEIIITQEGLKNAGAKQVTPPVETPPVETPPAVTPPVVTPPANQTSETKVVEESMWASPTDNPTEISGGATANVFDILKLAGAPTNYKFKYSSGAFVTDPVTGVQTQEQGSIIITRRSDGKQILVKKFEAMHFDQPATPDGNTNFIIATRHKKPFGDIEEMETKGYNLMIFGAGYINQSTNSGDIHLGTSSYDMGVYGGNGDELFFESPNTNNNNSMDVYSGGNGNDTFVAEGNMNDYKITKLGFVYNLERVSDNKKYVVRIFDIENIQFTDANGSLTSPMSVEEYYKLQQNAEKPAESTAVTEEQWKLENEAITLTGTEAGDNLVKLTGKVDDYIFSFDAGATNEKSDDLITITRRSDGKKLKIANYSGVKFEADSSIYRLLNNQNQNFGTNDLASYQGVKTISFSSGRNETALFAEAEYFFAYTTAAENIYAGEGDDTLFQGPLNTSGNHDIFDGEGGNDMFIFMLPEERYSFDYDATNNRYICYVRDANGTVDTSNSFIIKNIESVRFTDATGQLTSVRDISTLVATPTPLPPGQNPW